MHLPDRSFWLILLIFYSSFNVFRRLLILKWWGKRWRSYLLLMPWSRASKILVIHIVKGILCWKGHVFHINLMILLRRLTTLMLMVPNRWSIGLLTKAFLFIVTDHRRSRSWHGVQMKTMSSRVALGWARVKKRCHRNRLIWQTEIHQRHFSCIRKDSPRHTLECKFIFHLRTVNLFWIISWWYLER